jgi:preprotein translocase subunit SecA
LPNIIILQFKEQELYEKLGLTKVTLYSSLDEPLFTHFGGDKITNLVKQMGMKEDEAIEHALIIHL